MSSIRPNNFPPLSGELTGDEEVYTQTNGVNNKFDVSQIYDYVEKNLSGTTISPPTNITLSDNVIVTGSISGDVVCDLSTDAIPPFSYSIYDDPDNKFAILGGQLILKNSVDFNVKQSHNVDIKVTDFLNQSYIDSFTINILEKPPYENLFKTQFNGVDETIRFKTPVELRFNSRFTISMWVQLDPNIGNTTTLFSMWNAPNFNAYKLDLRQTNFPKALRLTVRNQSGSSTSDINTPKVIPALTKTHIVVVYSNGTVLFYVNGILIHTGSAGMTALFKSPFDAYIGSENGSSRFYSGVIDEVSIFDSSLNSSRVGLLYNGGVPSDISSLSFYSQCVLYCRMGEGSNAPIMKNETGNTLGEMINMDNTNFIPF